ncbi:MAG: hypothetical protein PVF38_21055, partial [Desulfobacterales bacterium]
MKKIILVIAAVALLASPAMAVDWNFYGSARMATFYESRDFGDSAASDLTGEGVLGDNGDEDANVSWELQGNSRLGATVKAENVGGRFEFGISSDGGGGNVSSRRIFGTWDFGAATLKVGKDYTPVKQFISGQAYDGDLGLLGIGTAYGSRRAQIGLSFGGFEVALIEPDGKLLGNMSTARTEDVTFILATNGVDVGITVGIENEDYTGGDVDEIIPKIEAAWGMSFDTWNFKINGGVNYYEIEDVTNDNGNEKDVDVVAWTIGADAGFNFGPAYVRGAINYAQNPKEGGWHISQNAANFDGDDDVDDVDMIMGALVAGFKFTDQLTFEGGYGYRQDDPDGAGRDDDQQHSFYVQAVVSLAPGVWLIPEVGYYDYEDDTAKNDEGDFLYLGAKWQIDF